jgi:dolichol-phosphate mannosyltransferase
MDLSVVIPACNEVDSICALLDEVCRSLEDSLDYEVIVIDDGSTDSTQAVLQEYRAGQPRLRVLRHTQCCGQSAAISSGVRAARGHWIVTLDGDGQNDPADIMHLYRAMDKAGERVMLVTGQRVNRRDDSIKRFSSRVANAVRARVLGDNTPDTGCGIKLFARETYTGLPQFDHMHRFLPALVQRQGGEVVSVAVNHRVRHGGESKYGIMNRLWVGIVDMLGVWWLQRRYTRPVVSEIDQS